MIGEEQMEKRIYQVWKYYSDNDRGCMLHKGRMPTY